MLSYDSLGAIPEDAFQRGTAVAIGKFDGVHRGHQVLLEHARAAAEEQDLEPIVFTFVANPQHLLHPERRLPPIMSQAQRLEAFAAAGITGCVIVPFDDELSAMSAERFAEEVLAQRLHVRQVSVGPDFHFGRGGDGDVKMLAEFGARFGFAVEVIPVVEDEELGRISSSRVREAILQGDVTTAARMLGRPVEVRGTVVRGDARGRDLGFPTANLGGEIEGLIPAEGVYAGWAEVRGTNHHAAISVGNNPTFTPEGLARVEAFLLDFEGDLYDEQITVRFAERLRGNVVFSGVEALIQRMREDVRETREILIGR